MKALEKTKRISIVTVLFILVIIIGLLSYKKPKHLYTVNSQSTLEAITSTNYFVTLSALNSANMVLIDIRNPYDFERGHLEKAINITASEILNEAYSEVLKNLKETNKTIVMYGNSPNEAMGPFMVLYQLGYNNINILAVENSYHQNRLITKNVTIEKHPVDINAFIKASIKKSMVNHQEKPKALAVPRKIIPIKKKRKRPVEGGC